MGRSNETFSKKEKEKKRLKKRKEKQEKKDVRKSSSEGGGLDNMIAYVDEFGNITDTPPDTTVKKKEIKASDIEIGVPKRPDEEEKTDFTGKVAFFNHSKGYGFINDVDSGDKYFVHIHGCVDEIEEGDKVTFELERGAKGMNAVNVKRI